MRTPIQSLWIGSGLSAMEQLCIRSFLANGHEFHLYTYQPMEGIPEGTIHRDGNEILPASMVFRDRDIESFSGFADLFRYKLLLERGGWWVDMDIVCLRPLPDPDEYAFALENANFLGNCVLFSPAGSAPLEYVWDVARKKEPAKLAWCEIGPPLVQDAVNRFGLQRSVMPPPAFCPVPSSRWYDTFVPGRRTEFGPESLGVHLWHEMWRRARLDKNEEYGPRSLYECLKARYSVGPEQLVR
jgi:hypothetical protein